MCRSVGVFPLVARVNASVVRREKHSTPATQIACNQRPRPLQTQCHIKPRFECNGTISYEWLTGQARPLFFSPFSLLSVLTFYCPLMSHQIGRGCIDCLAVLYTASEPLNVRDSTGATALHAAVRHGRIECAKFLATTGNIDVLSRDNVGGTPAHHAAYHGQLDSLQWLYEHANKSVDVVSPAATDGGTPLHFAAAMGWLGCLKWLVAICGNADIRDGKGTTPLYFAAQEGHTVRAAKKIMHPGKEFRNVLDSPSHLFEHVWCGCGRS